MHTPADYEAPADPQTQREPANNRLYRVAVVRLLHHLEAVEDGIEDDEYDTKPDFIAGDIPKAYTNENGNVLPQ